MAAWAIMKLMEDSVAAVTRCVQVTSLYGLGMGVEQFDIDWGAAIYMLQRRGTRRLCFSSWGCFPQT